MKLEDLKQLVAENKYIDLSMRPVEWRAVSCEDIRKLIAVAEAAKAAVRSTMVSNTGVVWEAVGGGHREKIEHALAQLEADQ